MQFKFRLAFLLACCCIMRFAFSEDSNADKLMAYEQHYPEISYNQLRKSMDAGQIFLIDANSTESYNSGHIPGAKSIANREQLAVQLPIPKSYPIAVYCGGPQCTAWHKAADFAAARGFTSIKHFKGGLKGWKAQGDTLVSGKD